MGSFTINGSGSYASLNAAVAAASGGDAIQATGTWSSSDTTSVSWDVAVTVTADSDSKQIGRPWKSGDTTYRLVVSGDTSIDIAEVDVDISDISIISTNNNDDPLIDMGNYSSDGPVDITLRRCHLGWDDDNTDQTIVYVDHYDTLGSFTVEFEQ